MNIYGGIRQTSLRKKLQKNKILLLDGPLKSEGISTNLKKF